jgi:hypothetical protein
MTDVTAIMNGQRQQVSRNTALHYNNATRHSRTCSRTSTPTGTRSRHLQALCTRSSHRAAKPYDLVINMPIVAVVVVLLVVCLASPSQAGLGEGPASTDQQHNSGKQHGINAMY